MHISDGDKNNEVSVSCDQVIHTFNKHPSRSKSSADQRNSLNVEASDESTSSTNCTCENCAGTCNCSDCADNNDIDMDYTDEPESDNEYTEDSDGDGDGSWRDMDDGMLDVNADDEEEDDDIDIGSIHDESLHDENMSEGMELMDAFSDLSDEDDTPHADNDNFPIGIEVDMALSSSSSYTSREDADDFYDEEDEESEEEHEDYDDEDEDVDVGDEEYFDGGLDSIDEDGNSDYDDNVSRGSFQSDGSSRSLVAVNVRAMDSPRYPSSSSQSSSLIQTPPSSLSSPVVPRSISGDSTTSPQTPALPQNQQTPKEALDVKPSSSNFQINNIDEPQGEDSTCCICLDGNSTHVVVPCGHICLCQACSQLLLSNADKKKKKCPLCKTKFSLIIKVYK